MDVNITQTCNSYHTDGLGNDICEIAVYSGRLDNLQVSIPMLEAMGLIFLWIVVAISVATLIKKFT